MRKKDISKDELRKQIARGMSPETAAAFSEMERADAGLLRLNLESMEDELVLNPPPFVKKHRAK